MNTMLNQPNYTPSHDSNTYEIDITAILHELWKNRWMLLLLASIGLGLGFFYSLRQPAQYESTALLQVDTKKSGLLSGSVESFAGNNRTNSVQTEVTLLQSRFVLEPVMKSLGLDIHVSQQLTTFKERLFPWLNKKNVSVPMFKVPESELNQTFQLVVDKREHISLYNEEDALVLSGNMGEVISTPDGAFRLETGKSLVPEGTRFNLSKHSVLAGVRGLASRLHVKEMSDPKQKFGGGTGILEISLTGTNKREVVRILNAVVDEARAQNESKQTREANKTLAFLNEQLPKSKRALEVAENALAQYKSKMGKTGSKPQTQFLLQELTALDQQLSAFEIEKIQMKAEYKPAHPAWMVLDNKVQALKQHREKVTESLKSLPASDQAVVHLMRDLKVKEKFNLLLLNSIQELEVRKAGIMSGIDILAYAVLPDGALPTHSKFNGLSGVALGFMLGVMIVFTRKLLLPRVDDPHWTERQLNLPNVVTLPYCKQQVENDERKKMRITDEVTLLAKTDPKDLTIEVLRSLRTSLHTTLACAENNLISILGVSPNIGKTFVSSNLAYLLAVGGKRVLLIDGDLRRGTLHQAFAISASPGLADVLGKDFPLDLALRPTLHDNLTVLSRGSYPKDPAELLTGEAFKVLVKKLSEQYDLVLLDTAPVLLVTDAVVIGSFCATNYLVVGAGEHSPKDLELAIKRLEHNDVRVTGSVFNFHRESDGKNSYYYNYNYNYSYNYNNSYYAHSEDELLEDNVERVDN